MNRKKARKSTVMNIRTLNSEGEETFREEKYIFDRQPKVSLFWQMTSGIANFLVHNTAPSAILFVILTIWNCSNLMNQNVNYDDGHEMVKVFGSLMVFLLGLAFNTGLSKYKETLKMYDEITGDIKALSMMMIHLTFDKEKYYQNKTTIHFKKDVEDQYKKIKYLLASIAPTVKDELGAPQSINFQCCSNKKTTVFDVLSERKYYAKREGLAQFFLGDEEISNYWKDANPDAFTKKREKLENYCEKNDLKPPSKAIQYALYLKIYDIHLNSDMDAFECTMTVLLDELMRVFENELGFGDDPGSAVATSAIEKWNSIYGTWGSLSSLKHFKEPFLVSLLRILLLAAYSWYTPTKYIQYKSSGNWVYIYALADVLFFTWLNWISYAIRNPFKKSNAWIIDTVEGTAIATQSQVLHFMSNALDFDRSDYRQNSRFGYGVISNEFLSIKPIGIGQLNKGGGSDIEWKMVEKHVREEVISPDEMKKYLQDKDYDPTLLKKYMNLILKPMVEKFYVKQRYITDARRKYSPYFRSYMKVSWDCYQWLNEQARGAAQKNSDEEKTALLNF